MRTLSTIVATACLIMMGMNSPVWSGEPRLGVERGDRLFANEREQSTLNDLLKEISVPPLCQTVKLQDTWIRETVSNHDQGYGVDGGPPLPLAGGPGVVRFQSRYTD